MTKTLFVVVAVLGLSAALALGQPTRSIQGVWRVQERTITGANPGRTTTPQPGIYIFTARHYSVVQIPGMSPRPTFDAPKVAGSPTDAEKLAAYPQWQQFNAAAGTYELKGTTLTTRPIVAKNESVMGGPGIAYQFKLDGAALWLASKSEDGKTTTEVRLTRIE